MIEDMFKLTIDQIFPKHSLKRKRRPVALIEANSPSKSSTKSKKTTLGSKNKSKNTIKDDNEIAEEIEAIPEDPQEEPVLNPE